MIIYWTFAFFAISILLVIAFTGFGLIVYALAPVTKHDQHRRRR